MSGIVQTIKNFKATLIAAIMVSIVLTFFAVYLYSKLPLIPIGTTLSQWEISGLRIDEFQKHMLQRLQLMEQQKVELAIRDSKHKKETFTLLQLGMKTNAKEIIQHIESLAHESLVQRVKNRWLLRNTDLYLTIDLEPDILENVIRQHWEEQLETQPTNAQRIITSDDQVRYIPGENSFQINLDHLRKDITSLAKPLLVDSSSADEVITLDMPMRIVHPQKTVESLVEEGIERKIKEFTTFFRTSGEGRIHNIRSTAKTVHDRVLQPGDVFDYEKVIQQTEKDYGFKRAPVIVNGKLVQGIGGGICQVSTTLYNAVIRSGLEIVERQNHSLPINYVPLGQDATFASGHINFKFRNNQDTHLLIRVETTNQQITVKLFGSLPENISYEIDSRVVKVIAPPVKYVKNPKLPQGSTQMIQSGKSGYIVETFRITKQDGKVVGKERITRDRYKARPSLVAANPKDIRKPDGSNGSNRLKDSGQTPAPRKQIIEDGVSGPVF